MGVALLAACSVETGGLGAGAAAPDTPGPSGGSVGEGTSGGVAGPNPNPSPAPEPDASGPNADSGDDADAADSGDAGCDADGDGVRARGCGGSDCCDADPEAFPGQQRFFARPTLCGDFDYDCSGAPEPEFGGAACERRVFRCDGDGFATATACGMMGDFVRCETDGLGCRAATSRLLQRCR